MKTRVVLVLAICFITGLAKAQTPVDETKHAEPKGSLDISNVSGSIDVVAWDRSDVQVTGTLGKGVERLDFDISGSRTLIHVVMRHITWHGGNTELTIHAPKDSSVKIDCVSADIKVKGITGDLDLKTTSGEVRAEGFAGTVDAKSVSGSLNLRGNSTEMEAQSISGEIKIEGSIGRVEASTISGEIDVNATDVRRLKCKAVSGEISFTGTLADKAQADLNCQSGSIAFHVPENTSAAFETSTFSGSITNHLSDAKPAKQEYSSGANLDFTLNSGSGRVELKTFSGSISLGK